MNCASRLLPHLRERPERLALWTGDAGAVSFAELGALAASAQRIAREERLRPGDVALVLVPPGPELFAFVLGLVGLGVGVVFIEPWLGVADIEHVVRLVRPRLFVGSRVARLWGLRVRAVRSIPRWIDARRVRRTAGAGLYTAEPLDPTTPAVITFTSGTTGRPKGILRTHRYLWDTHEILTECGTRDALDAPDLCVFPNLVLLHLGTGRGALIVPRRWTARALRRLGALPPAQRAASLTCGPAFLRRVLELSERALLFRELRSITIGGALTDCALFERGLARWPDARWTHVYGGTEAEPVTLGDAGDAVRRSRARGLFQTLSLGEPIPQIRTCPAPDGLWVSGPNVAPAYPGSEDGNGQVKRTDDTGALWHCMGDRVLSDAQGWWYVGRASQPRDEFELEQRLYARLGTSAGFVQRDPGGALYLYGERLAERAARAGVDLRREFPEIAGMRAVRIVRDRRHRARIDRTRSLRGHGYGLD